jgi:serine/threonine protein kinase
VRSLLFDEKMVVLREKVGETRDGDEEDTVAEPFPAESSASADDEFDELLQRVASAPVPSFFPEGTAVGEYRIVRLLGRGAFGTVYHATHLVIGKHVALKLLGAQFSDDHAMIARFVNEARAVNRIGHPNIVDIFGFGTLPDGRKYCVMELLRGQTLRERLQGPGPLARPEILEILRQMAAALAAAHDHGVVHRDVKPENVFLCSASPAAAPRATVKLLDFGIAQIADAQMQRTGSNLVLGTPAYMSPEQCRGSGVDYRSDIYALGVVAYELITGKRPFAGDSPFQLASQHLSATPPHPSALRHDLPSAVDDVVQALLAKAPENRPATATAAVDALAAAWLGGAQSSVKPGSNAPHLAVSVPLKRSPWRWAAVALLGIAALGIGARQLRSGRAAVAGATSARPTATEAPRPVASPREPASAAPVASRMVTLLLAGEPPSAKVLANGRELGRLGQPFSVERALQPLVLTVRAAGYAERELRVVPDQDRQLPVRLKRLPATRRSPDLEY